VPIPSYKGYAHACLFGSQIISLLARAETVTKVIAYAPESSMGPWARSVRRALRLTQQELADIAGISQEDVDLFEQSLPVRLDARRRILKELWAARRVE
jgi:DNA-binding transcriptional regulator YiaG